MNGLILLLVIGVPALALAFLVVLIVWHIRTGEARQVELDYQINLAIDRGDWAEVERLREQKMEVLLRGE